MRSARLRCGNAPAVTVTAPAEPTQASAHSPFPPDRRIRVPVGLRHHRADRAGRRGGVDVPAAGRFGQRVRHAAGPVGRLLPVRPGAFPGARQPAVPAGLDGAGDDVVHRDRMAGRHRRAGDGQVARPGPDRWPAAAARPTTRPAGMLVRTATCITGQVDLQLDCMPLFDYGRFPGAWAYRGSGYGEAVCSLAGQPELVLRSSMRLGYGGAQGDRADLAERGRVRVRGAVLAARRRVHRRGGARRRPRRRPGPGGTGCGTPARGCPIIPGGLTSSAAR